MYKIVNKCCVADCPVEECQEPVCAEDFPGGVKAFLYAKKHKKMINLLQSGFDIEDIKSVMGLDKFAVARLLAKKTKVS